MRERGQAHTREREKPSKIIFILLGFTFATGAHSISEKVMGFFPLCFPQGKLFVSSLMIIVGHVILLDKILYHIE